MRGGGGRARDSSPAVARAQVGRGAGAGRSGDNARMSEPDPGTCNIAAALPRLARERPAQVAMRCPGGNGRYGVELGYAQLDARSDAIAAGLAKRGVVRGTRTVVMVRPTPEFFLAMFALFKAGAVPVLVDPGIAKRALKQCLDEAQPQAFIGIPLAMFAKAVLGWAKSARVRIGTGARAWFADATLADVERDGANAAPQLADTNPDDIAAILFTSGSTGVPKGVVYRHRHFAAQVEMLRRAFDMAPGGVDLPTFPPFALFDPALGLTSVIPDMDPTRPARADPRKLHAAIERFGVDQLFGSPALMRVLAEHGRLPDAVTACVGGGSNAIGIFHAFLNDPSVRLVGAEAAGEGIETGKHASSLAAGRPGVLHGNRTYVICDDDGQIIETHSISAGLDYPGVGPEHAFLKDSGRAEYVGVTDEEALAAFHTLTRTEGILPALESSHAVAQAIKLARDLPKDKLVLCNLSGRGDKDVHTIAAREGVTV